MVFVLQSRSEGDGRASSDRCVGRQAGEASWGGKGRDARLGRRGKQVGR